MKVINPKGVEVEIPDDWAGTKLNEMLDNGFKVIHNTISIPTDTSVIVEQKIKDVQDLEEVVTPDMFDNPVIPEERLIVIEKNNKVIRHTKGHGKRKA